MANECKKFALFACCMMTMQALRLVISTAGFCVVRFHIDPELFNIFISRLVNAVLMSQLFGNWLGDVIVFTATGPMKLIAIAAANWAELACFCSALVCICAGEQGHLTGFYWSMVCAYFWWKVGEAPAIGIGVDEVDWYFAGFTLSGVWAACLKGLVMMCVGQGEKGIHSEALGEVNVTVVGDVSVVGRRSVKTTVDYRAAKWLYILTIVLTFLMCLVWELAAWVKTEVAPTDESFTRDWMLGELEDLASKKVDGQPAGTKTESKLWGAIKEVGSGNAVDVKPEETGKTLDFSSAEVPTRGGVTAGEAKNEIVITVKKVTATDATGTIDPDGPQTMKVADKVKEKLNKLITRGSIEKVKLSKTAALTSDGNNEIIVTATVAKGDGTRGYIGEALKSMAGNKLKEAIKNVTSLTVDTTAGSPPDNTKTLDFTSATVDKNDVKASDAKEITITVKNVKGTGHGSGKIKPGTNTGKVQDAIKEALEKLIARGWAGMVTLSGAVPASNTAVTLKVSVGTGGWITGVGATGMAVLTATMTGAIFAIPGALTFAALGKCCNFGFKAWVVLGGILGFSGGAGTIGGSVLMQTKNGKDELDEMWVPHFKWGGADMKDSLPWAAVIGLRKGTLVGALAGLWIGSGKGSKKAGLLGGAFIGGFFGLWFGEIYNGYKTWTNPFVTMINKDGGGNDKREMWVVVCGFFIVVFGLGTVYSIYPGMAPCSITQFQYFNIIDIWILILSSIAPIVIMGVDLAEAEWRLGKTILTQVNDTSANTRMWAAVASAVAMLIGTNICEIIVLSIMQHPFSKTAQKVTSSGWRACFLTIMMVSFQLTSTGVGFGCVAAGSGFNDGVYNALSTLTLWTTECCGVLGEGYLTELKKYEPGKWPTQGMGRWKGFNWWCGKSFSNAWAIWTCIGTTDLRRDIMLCRQ